MGQMNRQPIIGVTPLVDAAKESYWMLPGYFNGILQAGGLPLMLPLTTDASRIAQLCHFCDGILLTGGQDIQPELYGAEPLPCCGECSTERDKMELQLLELAFQQDLPVLGICRGLQLLNVCFGGTLYQDLPEQVSNSISHHQIPPYDQPVHTVSVLPETPLAALLEQETLAVNSYHHQGILKLAEALQPMAVAPDGLIESVWLPEKAFVWGVQWHPEYDYQKNVASQQIFQAFVQAAYKQKK